MKSPLVQLGMCIFYGFLGLLAALAPPQPRCEASPVKSPAAKSPAEKMLAGSRPNILVILTDDQGYGDTSGHHHPFLKTPNLDR